MATNERTMLYTITLGTLSVLASVIIAVLFRFDERLDTMNNRLNRVSSYAHSHDMHRELPR